MFSLLFLFLMLTGNTTRDIITGCAIVISGISRIFFTGRKYVTTFHIAGNTLTITYLTPFLKPCSQQFTLTDFTHIQVTNGHWLSERPASVNLKHKEEWITFDLINKKLQAEVKADIAEANQSIARRAPAIALENLP